LAVVAGSAPRDDYLLLLKLGDFFGALSASADEPGSGVVWGAGAAPVPVAPLAPLLAAGPPAGGADVTGDVTGQHQPPGECEGSTSICGRNGSAQDR